MKVYILVYDYVEDNTDHFNIAAFDSKQQAEKLAERLNHQFSKLPARYHVEEIEYIVDANEVATITSWSGSTDVFSKE